MKNENPAVKWLDGEISMAKLIELCECPRPSGDNLAGLIWQAMYEKMEILKLELERRRDLADKYYAQALAEEKMTDATAESAARLAYITSLSQLQFIFGMCLDKTRAAT